MQAFLIGLIGRWGYAAIALLIAVENIFPPIPSEVILTFGGFMTTRTGMTVFGAAFFATLGSVAGAMALYGVGGLARKGDPVRFAQSRWGRILGLRAGDLERATAWFERRGGLAVLLCRVVPILRSLISLPAGMARMPLGRFVVLTTLGAACWNTALCAAGAALGSAWQDILSLLDGYAHLAAAVLLLALLCVWIWLSARKKDR